MNFCRPNRSLDCASLKAHVNVPTRDDGKLVDETWSAGEDGEITTSSGAGFGVSSVEPALVVVSCGRRPFRRARRGLRLPS